MLLPVFSMMYSIKILKFLFFVGFLGENGLFFIVTERPAIRYYGLKSID